MSEHNEDHIFIVTGIGGGQEQRRAERGLPDAIVRGTVQSISVSALRKNMASFFDQLREILQTGSDTIGAFQVEQVEVDAQVTGDGKVCLLGSGVQLGFQGGIKFILKRT